MVFLHSQNRTVPDSGHVVSVVSGGTATNSLVSVFDSLQGVKQVSFILPISDNGGSSAEILRVFGGPAIGDIRSRITKLTCLKDKESKQKQEDSQLGEFFSYRLSIDRQKAVAEWDLILYGQHQVCSLLVNRGLRLYILFLFVFLNREIVVRNRDFNFQNASIGNLFMVSLRLFYGFDINQCADFFVRLVGIDSKFSVIPSINAKEERYNIAALLENGIMIKGQSQISHPSPTVCAGPRLTTPSDIDLSALELNQPQLIFQKDHTEPLPSPIRKIYYMSRQYEEFQPAPFSEAQTALAKSKVVVYSIGSLMTSILPVLILKGTAEAILDCHCINGKCTKKKVLMLNGNTERETGDMNGLDIILKIIEGLLYSLGLNSDEETEYLNMDYFEHIADEALEDKGIDIESTSLKVSLGKLLVIQRDRFTQGEMNLKFTDFVTDLFFLDHSNIDINRDVVEKVLGIKCSMVKANLDKPKPKHKEGDAERECLKPDTVPHKLILHYKYNLQDFGDKLNELLSQ